MDKAFRMLSFVQRWAIAPRLHHQTVAEHCFFVTLYASYLCHVIGASIEDRFYVMEYALRHDADEVYTSDIPGPAKRAVIDPEKLEDFQNAVYETLDGPSRFALAAKYKPICGGSLVIKDIIKIADLLDEVFFLHVESLLGNKFVTGLTGKAFERLMMALERLRPEYRKEILLDLKEQLSRLTNEGAVIPENNSDLSQEAAE